jgi:hypothetical protein
MAQPQLNWWRSYLPRKAEPKQLEYNIMLLRGMVVCANLSVACSSK